MDFAQMLFKIGYVVFTYNNKIPMYGFYTQVFEYVR